MDANLTALNTDSPLPYAAATGQTSELAAPATTGQTDPRSHSAQVKS